MKALLNKIKDGIANYEHNASLYANGNKAAGLRARKASLELEKLFKEFRKRSVNETPSKD